MVHLYVLCYSEVTHLHYTKETAVQKFIIQIMTSILSHKEAEIAVTTPAPP